jgi:hypothetical protein
LVLSSDHRMSARLAIYDPDLAVVQQRTALAHATFHKVAGHLRQAYVATNDLHAISNVKLESSRLTRNRAAADRVKSVELRNHRPTNSDLCRAIIIVGSDCFAIGDVATQTLFRLDELGLVRRDRGYWELTPQGAKLLPKLMSGDDVDLQAGVDQGKLRPADGLRQLRPSLNDTG